MGDEYATPNGYQDATRPPPQITRKVKVDGVWTQIEITKEDAMLQTKVYYFADERIDERIQVFWDRWKYWLIGFFNAFLVFAGWFARGYK